MVAPASLRIFFEVLTKRYAFKRLNYEITALSANRDPKETSLRSKLYSSCYFLFFSLLVSYLLFHILLSRHLFYTVFCHE